MPYIKDLTCPFCRKALPLGQMEHDKDMNLLCNSCKKIVFAVTIDADDKLRKDLLSISGSSSTGNYTNYSTYKKEPLPISMSPSYEKKCGCGEDKNEDSPEGSCFK